MQHASGHSVYLHYHVMKVEFLIGIIYCSLSYIIQNYYNENLFKIFVIINRVSTLISLSKSV